MKKLILSLSIMAFTATATPIDGTVKTGLKKAAITAERVVRMAGYKCDSISSFRKLIMSRGFHINCNRFNYSYAIKDVGG